MEANIRDPVVFGQIALYENEWSLSFNCKTCCLAFKTLITFLRHSLRHYFDVGDDDLDVLIKKLANCDEWNEYAENELENFADDGASACVSVDSSGQDDDDITFEQVEVLFDVESDVDILSIEPEVTEINNTTHCVSSDVYEMSMNEEAESSESGVVASDNAEHANNERHAVAAAKPKSKRKKLNAQASYEKLATKSGNQLFCPVCEKRYHSIKSYNSHVKRHSNTFACDICAAVFNDACNLKEHRNRHLGNKPHKCDTCAKTFTTTTELKVHKRVHTGEKPYVCDQCGSSYKTSSHLTLHYRKHTNTRPHQCELCNKAFYKKYDLNVHKRVHTNERPYVCGVCDQRFGRYDSLKQHRKLHAPNKSYRCDYCAKTFAQYAGLYAHLKSHTVH